MDAHSKSLARTEIQHLRAAATTMRQRDRPSLALALDAEADVIQAEVDGRPRRRKETPGALYVHATHGRYMAKRIEDVEPGDVLDMGAFVEVREVGETTLLIGLENGNAYTETRDAVVRVWIDER